MEAVTIRAEEIRVGDELVSADPVGVPEPAARVIAVEHSTPWFHVVEVWTDWAGVPLAMPCLNLSPGDRVEVRREVER